MSHDLQDFMVSLREMPDRGDAKVLVELLPLDRETVQFAASLVGLSAQKFMRAVLVSAAQRVLKEKGVKFQS